MTSGRTSSTKYHSPAGVSSAAVRRRFRSRPVPGDSGGAVADAVDAAMRGRGSAAGSTRQPPTACLNSA